MSLSSEILIDEAQLDMRVRAMSSAIAADTPEGVSLSVLALMDGAFMFCADLVRRLPMPVHMAFVKVVSVTRGGDPRRLQLPPEFPIKGADVLIVEDILDTGRTLTEIRKNLVQRGPRRVRMAVLLDKPARRAVGIKPEYVGFRVDDRWVVGYGLDSEELYRNLPYISYVKPV